MNGVRLLALADARRFPAGLGQPERLGDAVPVDVLEHLTHGRRDRGPQVGVVGEGGRAVQLVGDVAVAAAVVDVVGDEVQPVARLLQDVAQPVVPVAVAGGQVGELGATDLGVRVAGVDGVRPRLDDDVDVLLLAPRPELRQVGLVPQPPPADAAAVAAGGAETEVRPAVRIVGHAGELRAGGRPGRSVGEGGEDLEAARLGGGGDGVVERPVEVAGGGLDVGPDEVDPHPADAGRLRLVEQERELLALRRMDVDAERRRLDRRGAAGTGEERQDEEKRRAQRPERL